MWIGDGSDVIPCLTRLYRCEHCAAIVLADDLSRHLVWHIRQGHEA